MSDKKSENKKWRIKVIVYPEIVGTCVSPFVKEELEMTCADAQVSGRLSHLTHVMKCVIKELEKGDENVSNKCEKLG